jgi:hypothetical protein
MRLVPGYHAGEGSGEVMAERVTRAPAGGRAAATLPAQR